MRPSEQAVEQSLLAFGKNNELIVECFQKFLKEIKYPENAPQTTIDILFFSFAAGISEPITPGSDFNTGYKI